MYKQCLRVAVYAILFLSVMAILWPIMYYCMLSIPYADDFSNSIDCLRYINEYSNKLIAAFKRTQANWIGFQGTYTGIFALTAINPFAEGSLLKLRIFNTTCVALFWAALMYMIYSFCRNSHNSLIQSVSTFAITTFWITNNYMNSEIYTWMTVICVYIIPLVFLLFGVGVYLRYVDNGEYEWVIASVLAFFAGGAAINVSTLGCGMFLVVFLYGLYQKRPQNRLKLVTPVAVMIAATLINVLAPGNYVRWGDGHKVSILKVIITSGHHVIIRLCHASTRTPFIILIVVLFVVAHKYAIFDFDGKLTYKHPIGVAMMYFLGCIIVVFPYCLGVKAESIEQVLEDRSLFVMDISIYLLTVLWVYYVVGCFRKRFPTFEFDRGHTVLIILAVISNVLLVIGGHTLFDYTTPYMIRSIINGSAKDYSVYQEEIIDAVKNGDDEFVFYYDTANHEKKEPFIIGLGLSDDPERWDMWHNSAFSRYYGKKPVRVVYCDDGDD